MIDRQKFSRRFGPFTDALCIVCRNVGYRKRMDGSSKFETMCERSNCWNPNLIAFVVNGDKINGESILETQ